MSDVLFDVNIDITSLKELAKKLEKPEGFVDSVMRECMNALSGRILRWTMEETPAKSAQLAKGWLVGDIERYGKEYRQEIYNNVEYAPYVEYGFNPKPHWVPGLKLVGNEWKMTSDFKDGTYVFANKKRMPGYFMMTNAVFKANTRMGTVINRILDKRVRELLKP